MEGELDRKREITVRLEGEMQSDQRKREIKGKRERSEQLIGKSEFKMSFHYIIF